MLHNYSIASRLILQRLAIACWWLVQWWL